MRQVLIVLGGVQLTGVVERDFVLVPVADVLAAGGSLQACAPPEPAAASAARPLPPPPPPPRRDRPRAPQPKPPVRPHRPPSKPAAATPSRPPAQKFKVRGGSRWNKQAKRQRRR